MASIVVRTEDGRRVSFETAGKGDARSLARWLAAHGWPLNTRCGERGLCRGCVLQLHAGTLDLPEGSVSAPARFRSCQVPLAQCAGKEIEIEVPPRSRMDHRPQVGEDFRVNLPIAHQPLFEPVPGRSDTAFAIDVGTTTVVVLLLDLVDGAVLARASGFNAQLRFGDNVLTRIAAATDETTRRALQSAIVTETIAPLLDEACARAGRDPSRLAGGAVAGNTTMLHLLAGEDPRSLGFAPFRAGFLEGRCLTCGDLGLESHDGSLAPPTPVQLLPGIAAFIGADLVGGIYASGLLYDSGPSLLVDLGTNGEIILQRGGRLTACATAAGPAFEGCGLSAGTRAGTGAVSGLQLRLDPWDLQLAVIGRVPPARATGLCGSAYLDFLAEGRRCGLLLPHGRFAEAAWARLPPQRQGRIEGVRALVLGTPADRSDLSITEADLAVLLQAKAAIGAGIETLLETAGTSAEALTRVHLAGGFGMHLNVTNAIAAGLLPGFRPEQVEVVGNTALAGAYLALLDRTTLAEMEALRATVEVLELNLQAGFEDRFIENLRLP